ncbi:DUF6471 domain-containing protein [Xanthobacter dioxanivorans]|uniref:DUF6471 domain-containing protein n=1 Tax=Xanthobacter dioxanivorans TaxID=2528964 RepID=UPI001E532CB7|nr:DUF6471 domain-containing protein [Xanthobacter dioxanivorans]
MAEAIDWEARVKGLLKAELKRRNVTYADLVEKLAAIGVEESEPNVRNKLSRGSSRRYSCFSVSTPSAFSRSGYRTGDKSDSFTMACGVIALI